MNRLNQALIGFVRREYGDESVIPLHAPILHGNEYQYVNECLDSTFVSSIGKFVGQFERRMCEYTGAAAAVAVVNGTAALHTALHVVGVRGSDLVITQPLTFVATCNAICYCGAEPVFVDVDRQTLGLSSRALDEFLLQNAELRGETCYLKQSDRVFRACVPMHTFGHPVDLDGLLAVCARWRIPLIEDAAEAMGSRYKGVHTGRFGRIGVLSFNGNKIVTTGGGGMLLFEDEVLGRRARHLTTTAKIAHAYEFAHDEIGYNYRLPNINAALGCAQLEQLDRFIEAKRELATRYRDFFDGSGVQFFAEPPHCRSNYWLNTVICTDREQRDTLLRDTNSQGVSTRPPWQLMSRLSMFAACLRGSLSESEWLADRILNLPSSVPPAASGIRVRAPV